MNRRLALPLLTTIAFAIPAPSPAEGSGTALLRCDPSAVIKSIDGDKKQYFSASHGRDFRECAIELAPGPHTLEVCYDASSAGSAAGPTVVMCAEDRIVTLDARAGNLYRFKLTIGRVWRAWIEDVTDTEPKVTYADALPKPARSGSKAGRESFVVLRVSPDYAVARISKGEIRGTWFFPKVSWVKLEGVGTQGAKDGYLIGKVSSGDNLFVTYVRLMVGSIFLEKAYTPCGDYQGRAFGDIPAGKVLFLGRMDFSANETGQAVRYTDDLAEAREYVDAHHPKLAGRLEAAPFRLARFPEPCRFLGQDLSIAADR